jgi:hypothetical protein
MQISVKKSPLVWSGRVVSKFHYTDTDQTRKKVCGQVCDQTKNPYMSRLNGPGPRPEKNPKKSATGRRLVADQANLSETRSQSISILRSFVFDFVAISLSLINTSVATYGNICVDVTPGQGSLTDACSRTHHTNADRRSSAIEQGL